MLNVRKKRKVTIAIQLQNLFHFLSLARDAARACRVWIEKTTKIKQETVCHSLDVVNRRNLLPKP